LIAELCAAFLCAEFSLDGELRHAGYIQSWIGLLKADCRAPFSRHATRRKPRLIICAALRFGTSSRQWQRELPKNPMMYCSFNMSYTGS
jgi:antirestriction protein ArdC